MELESSESKLSINKSKSFVFNFPIRHRVRVIGIIVGVTDGMTSFIGNTNDTKLSICQDKAVLRTK